MSKKYTYLTTKKCLNCGKKFKTPRPRQKCCCADCSRKYIQQSRDEKYSKTVYKCDWCGNEYTPRIGFQRFCTIACGQAAYRQRRIAEKIGEEPILKRDKPKQNRSRTYDKIAIDRLREREGLRPLAPAQVECLSCGNIFRSEDKINFRICPNCKDNEEFNSVYL